MAKLAESARRAKWIDRDATVRSWALNESLGRSRGGVVLTEAGVNEIFRRVEEGVLDSIKKGVSAVGGAIGSAAKKGWASATNKITYDSLGMNWRAINPQRTKNDKLGMTADSEEIEVFLRRQGVKDPLMVSVFKQMGIPLSTVSTQGGDEPAQADDTDATASTKPGAGAEAPAAQSKDGAVSTAGGKPAAQSDADGKVGDANDLIRDLEADKAKKTTGGAAPAGGAPAKNPYAFDYAAAAKMAGIKPAAAKPDYSKTMPGYGKVNMTMKPPTGAAQPAAPAKAAPVTGQPGVRGTVPKPASQTGYSDEEMAMLATAGEQPSFPSNPDSPEGIAMRTQGLSPEAKARWMQSYNQQQANKKSVAAEQRRVYGGKYIKESAANKTAREFEFYLSKL
jgi:hypothetical protein